MTKVYETDFGKFKLRDAPMPSGHKITLPAGTRIKDGKLTKPPARMSVSARIKQRKSKRIKPVRRTV